MKQQVLFENSYLFGNKILEAIPHPDGILGSLFDYISIICHLLGGTTFFIFLIPFIYIAYKKELGVKLLIAVLSTGIINGLSKFFFESIRPINLSNTFDSIQKSVVETSFGFPSGHSHVSILMWGIIFINFKNKFIKGISLFLIIFTPLSRLYSGVHFPGDVLGGWLMGFISLIIIEKFFIKYPEFPTLTMIEVSDRKKAVKTFSLLTILITILPMSLYSIGMEYAKFSSLKAVVSASGSLAGFFIGILILKYKLNDNYYDWQPIKNLKEFLFRSSILLPVIIIFYFLIGMISKKLFSDEVMIIRYLRYIIINISVILVVPILMKKFHRKFLK